MEEKKKYDEEEVIDLRIVFRKLYARKKLFFSVWGITFVLSCAYILPQPRYYFTDMMLAPEMGGQSTGGALAGIASSFGFDLGNMETTDAFYPELYPDLMGTNEFLVDLLNIKVKTADGTVDTDYFTYMTKHQKRNPYAYPFNWCKQQINHLIEGKPQPLQEGKRLNPRQLSRLENMLVEKVRKSVTCDVDVKTNVITIITKAQDALVCATLADSASVRLQSFITSYRTSKARIDEAYYKQLMDSAEVEYRASQARYSAYCDAHQNIILQSFISERDDLENDLQAKMATYNAMQTQYQAAKAKVQEQTPAFTVLKGATVPVKPNSPKRMIFVAAMMFLSFFATCFHIFKKEIIAQFLGGESQKG